MDKIINAILKVPGLSRAAEATLGHYVTIFMLHRSKAETPSLLGTDPAVLEECLRYAQKNNFQFLSIDEVVELANSGHHPDRPSICFTLDDGFIDQTQVLIPLLLKYNAKPTIFVLENFVSQSNWPWDAKVSYLLANTKAIETHFTFSETIFRLDTSNINKKILSRRQIVSYLKRCNPAQVDLFIGTLSKLLGIDIPSSAPPHFNAPDWESLRELERQGLKIGSHAASHHPFTSLDDGQIHDELTQSWTTLEREIKKPSKVFCYPSGTRNDFDARHADLIRASGYIGAVTALPGNTTLAKIALAPYTIPRHSFPTSLDKFVRYTSWIELIRSKLS